MRGIEVPERTEDFSADPVELFFDLSFVFGFSQLVGVLVRDPSWGGVGNAALLFGLLWIPWQQLTWSANAVSGNGRRVRLIFLIATAISVPMAAATSTALGVGGPVFAISLSAIMLLGFLIQTLSFTRESGHYDAVLTWIAPNLLAIAVLVVGAFVDGGARTTLWGISLLIVFGAMVAAGRGEWIIRSAHFAERHGLIVIIALGEVIVAIGLPVVESLEAGSGVPGRTVAALVASGAFAGFVVVGVLRSSGPRARASGRGHRRRSRAGAIRPRHLHLGARADRGRDHPVGGGAGGDRPASNRQGGPHVSDAAARRPEPARARHHRLHLARLQEGAP